MISTYSGFVSTMSRLIVLICVFGGCAGSQATPDTAAEQDPEPAAGNDLSQPEGGEDVATAQTGESQGAQLVEERCVGCHDLDIVYEETLSREGWLEEVNVMVSRGARLSEEERDMVVDYLASR